jgi:hypothetical protein
VEVNIPHVARRPKPVYKSGQQHAGVEYGETRQPVGGKPGDDEEVARDGRGFSPPELSGFFKNHFSSLRNSPVSPKIVFQASGTLRFLQKSFFSPPELSGFSKNHFSSLRNSPVSPKIIFQASGTLRFLQKSFFKPPELSGFSKNHFSAHRNSPVSPKIIFQSSGTLRFRQKPFRYASE